MALTITNRGIWTHNTSSGSFDVSPTSSFGVGVALIFISADNSSGGGGSNNINGVTDSIGNTWSEIVPVVFDNGAANAGVQGSWWATAQDVGTLTTGTTVTVSTQANTVAKSGSFTQVSGSAGTPQIRTSGDRGAGATGTALTMTSAAVNVGEALLCGFCIEAGTTQTCTGDSDTTNGTWSTLQYAEIGSTTSGNCSATQGKIQTTAASTQTYNCTLGISSDYHGAYVIVEEVTPPPTDVTPGTGVLTLGAADPAITLGALNVTPAPAVLILGAVAPTVELGGGAQNITPTVAVLALGANAPAATLGAINVTPTPAIAVTGAATPTATVGALNVTPTPAVLALTAASPSTGGTQNITPTAAVLITGAAAPTVTLGAVSATPTPAIVALAAAAPTVTRGALNVTPTTAVLAFGATAPTVQIVGGNLNITPAPAVLLLGAATPTVEGGDPTIDFGLLFVGGAPSAPPKKSQPLSVKIIRARYV